MALKQWYANPDGRIFVSDDGGVSFAPPTLSGFEATVMRDKVIAPWNELANENSVRTGIPYYWILGIIKQESNGNPRIVSPDHGYGLMQLTSAAALQGHTGQETLDDPALNVRLGTDLLARIVVDIGSYDLPEVASEYNAGDPAGNKPWPSQKSPWGFRETTGYISHVVAGSNFALDYATPPQLPEPPVDDGIDPVAIASKTGVGVLTVIALLGLAFGGAYLWERNYG